MTDFTCGERERERKGVWVEVCSLRKYLFIASVRLISPIPTLYTERGRPLVSLTLNLTRLKGRKAVVMSQRQGPLHHTSH